MLGEWFAPQLITDWTILSQSWLPYKAEKRAWQLDFILNNVDVKRNNWFYFDLDYGKWLYLNGLPKVKSGSSNYRRHGASKKLYPAKTEKQNKKKPLINLQCIDCEAPKKPALLGATN